MVAGAAISIWLEMDSSSSFWESEGGAVDALQALVALVPFQKTPEASSSFTAPTCPQGLDVRPAAEVDEADRRRKRVIVSPRGCP